MASVSRASGPSARGSSWSRATVTRSAVSEIRSARVRAFTPAIPPAALRELGGLDPVGLAAGPHDDLLDPQARGFEPRLAMRLQARAALVHLDRPFERRLAGFQL